MTTATTLNPRDVARRLTPYVNTALAAKAMAQLERERVDKIQRRVLLEMGYTNLEPKDVWQMSDSMTDPYYKRLNEIHLAEGFEDAAKGYCPALCAEELLRQAERALIEAAEEFFGVDLDALLRGTKNRNGLDTLREYLDLLTGLVVNQPGYKHPLQSRR